MSDVNIAYDRVYGKYSFGDGVKFYTQGIQDKANGYDENAKIQFVLAADIFRMCSGQHPEAAQYLEWAEQELQNLGG